MCYEMNGGGAPQGAEENRSTEKTNAPASPEAKPVVIRAPPVLEKALVTVTAGVSPEVGGGSSRSKNCQGAAAVLAQSRQSSGL